MSDLYAKVREYANACMILNEAKKRGRHNTVSEVNAVTITGREALRAMLDEYGFYDLEQPD